MTFSVYEAIADPTRRSILDALAAGEQPVNRLAEPFVMSRPAVSQHLRVLREAGLVRERRVGRERRYSLDATPLGEVAIWIATYRRFWANRMDRLGAVLEEIEPSHEPSHGPSPTTGARRRSLRRRDG